MGSILSEAKEGASKRVGGLLQMRKKLFKEKKKEEVEKMVEEEIHKMEEKETQEQDSATKDQKVDETTDKASEADPTAQTKAKAESEQTKEPKVSAINKLKTKIANTGEAINKKAPILYKTGAFIKDLWKETFPSDHHNVKSKIERRREVAKMQQQYTEEELEEMQDQIPEWKRTAVTIADESKVEDKRSGLIKRLYKKVGSKVSDTSIAKQIMESEEFKEFKKKYREVKHEAEEFKENLKEEVETAQNPVISQSRSVGGYIFRDTITGQAILKMREYDPDFDIDDLSYEVEEVFTDLFDNFLQGNLEYIEKFTDEAALAKIKTELTKRKKEGWEPRFKELVF